MASQLKTKFIKNDAVDGSKLKLKHGETLRGTDGSGNEIDILSNIDSSIASVQSSVNSEVSRAQAAEGVLQTNINNVQAEVDAEEVRALAAESAISVSLSNEVTRATGIEAGLQSQIDSLSSSSSGSVAAEEARALAAEAVLQSNIDAEETRAIAAESALQSEIDAEETRAIAAEGAIQSELDLTQSGAGLGPDGSYATPMISNYLGTALSLKDADSLLDTQIKVNSDDIVDLVNEDLTFLKLDGTRPMLAPLNMNNIGWIENLIGPTQSHHAATKGYVDTQISGVQSQIDSVISNIDPAAIDSFTEVVEAFQAADASLNGAITALASSASSGLAAEVSRAEAAEAALQSDIDAEETRALAAESALSSSISSEVSRATAAEGVLDGRLDILEPKVAALEAIVEAGHAKVLDSTDISNGYINLPHLIVGMLEMYVDKLRLHSIGSSPDFSISTVGGVTRVTFLNNMVSPSEQALAVGDELFCYYKHS